MAVETGARMAITVAKVAAECGGVLVGRCHFPAGLLHCRDR